MIELPLVYCSHCGAMVPECDAEYLGEQDGPDLMKWPVWICDECVWEMEEEA